MPYVVVGFYTPNYAEIADQFRSNLQSHAIPHHLYAVDRIGETWIAETLRKPSIVLEAMGDYPDKTIILMDVDCSVTGHLGPLMSDADVSVHMIHRRLKSSRACSRVVVFRPTPAARSLAALWKELCDEQIDRVRTMRLTCRQSRKLAVDDEVLLLKALLSSPGLTIKQLPIEHVGIGAGATAPLVTHASAHDQFAPPAKLLPAAKASLKSARRRIVEVIVGQPYEQWKYGGWSR